MAYDKDGFPEEFSQIIEPDEFGGAAPEQATDLAPHVPMREQFPEAGTTYLGGTSDGWEYRTTFGGSNFERTFELLKLFLQEEGYADVPLPETAEELRLFRRPRPGQQQLFGERGYAHNPIKILFLPGVKNRNTLILCVFNEKSAGHLLRFHGVGQF